MTALIKLPLQRSPRQPLAAQPNQPRFVFGLWGSQTELTPAQYDRWRTKTVPDMQRGLPLARNLNAVLYAIGRDSAAALTQAAPDQSINVLAPQPGNLWLAKLRIMRDALQRWPAIVWLDWDVTRLRPLPHDFWSRLAAKHPLQAKIRQYHRRKCAWRLDASQRGQRVEANPRTCASGAFIYCRETALIDQCIRESVANPGYDDQQTICRVLDRISGGWQGIDYWHQHYDPPWYTIGGETFVCPRSEAVFTAR